MENKKLTMTNEWDKIFPKSGKVNHRKITFHNRYGITLAGGNVFSSASIKEDHREYGCT